jgi:hypothetical protein
MAAELVVLFLESASIVFHYCTSIGNGNRLQSTLANTNSPAVIPKYLPETGNRNTAQAPARLIFEEDNPALIFMAHFLLYILKRK